MQTVLLDRQRTFVTPSKTVYVVTDNDVLWAKRLDELRQYNTLTGHSRVPTHYPKNPALGIWVSHQRVEKKARRLSDFRMARLNALNFEWAPVDSLWEACFAELVRFKGRTGHCNVPARYGENRKLGAWVANQRYKMKKGQLTAYHIDRLTGVGFVWSPRTLKKQSRVGKVIPLDQAPASGAY